MNIRELMEAFSKKSGNELRDICRENFEKLSDFLDENNVNQDYKSAYAQGLWRLFVSADRRTRGDEYNLFLASIGFTKKDFSQDRFFEMTNKGADPDFVNWFVRETNKFPVDIQYAVCTIGVCIMSVDEDVNDDEVKLLERLLA